ncbi:MAG: efflux RND transporter periplasmic adaptor subunit [Pseudomonadota bacterium]
MRAALLSAVVLLGLVAWVVTGQGVVSRESSDDAFEPTTNVGNGAKIPTRDSDGLASLPYRRGEPAPTRPAPVLPPTRVRVATGEAEEHQGFVVLRGLSRASRVVSLRAEVDGRVVELPIPKGGRVNKGDVIARLAMKARAVALREADALLEQRRIEHEAAKKLHTRGYRAQTTLAASQAALEAARTTRARIKEAIDNTSIRAPFDGVLNARGVEVGDYVMPGQVLGVVADLNPLIVQGHASERERASLRAGQAGTARFLDGGVYTGRLRYVSAMADPSTRTFSVELELDADAPSLFDGLTAELRFPTVPVRAHRVPNSALTLTRNGDLSIKIVKEERVIEVPVRVLALAERGVWVWGLPTKCNVIIVGAEFVRANDVVASDNVGSLRSHLGQ